MGSHRRHLAAGRRHRDHEHHARLGARADPRDRRPPRPRRDAKDIRSQFVIESFAISLLGGFVGRGDRRRPRENRRGVGRLADRRDALVADSVDRRLDRRRPRVRHLSRGKSRGAGPDRSAPVRVGEPCGRPESRRARVGGPQSGGRRLAAQPNRTKKSEVNRARRCRAGVPPAAPTSRQRQHIGSAGRQAGVGDPFKESEPRSGDTCAAAARLR